MSTQKEKDRLELLQGRRLEGVEKYGWSWPKPTAYTTVGAGILTLPPVDQTTFLSCALFYLFYLFYTAA